MFAERIEVSVVRTFMQDDRTGWPQPDNAITIAGYGRADDAAVLSDVERFKDMAGRQ